MLGFTLGLNGRIASKLYNVHLYHQRPWWVWACQILHVYKYGWGEVSWAQTFPVALWDSFIHLYWWPIPRRPRQNTTLWTSEKMSYKLKVRPKLLPWYMAVPVGWRRSIVVRMLVSAGELSLSCARLLAGWVTTLRLSRLLSVSQHGQLSHPSLRGR